MEVNRDSISMVWMRLENAVPRLFEENREQGKDRMKRLFGKHSDVCVFVADHGSEFWKNLVQDRWREVT